MPYCLVLENVDWPTDLYSENGLLVTFLGRCVKMKKKYRLEKHLKHKGETNDYDNYI